MPKFIQLYSYVFVFTLLSVYAITNDIIMSNLVHVHFCLLEAYPQGRFLEVHLMGTNTSVFVVC